MPLEDVARIVALVAGAGLLAAIAAAHLIRGPQGAAGVALGLLGVLLIGFPLLERFELGVGPEGGSLSGELRTDIAVTEAQLVARIDALGEKLDRLALPRVAPAPAPGDGGGEAPVVLPEPEPEPETAPPPPETLRPGEGLLALVFHRAARGRDAAALVEALRGLGFAASAVPTDLTEAEDAPEGTARILWERDRRQAAEAAAEAAADLSGAGEARLAETPADLARGDVQIQLF
jgi:hypothetical protein